MLSFLAPCVTHHKTYYPLRHMDEKISQLHIYLEHLPTSLPSSDPLGSYAWLLNFTPDEDWLKDIGEEGAVNQELELALGHRDDNNTFPIQE